MIFSNTVMYGVTAQFFAKEFVSVRLPGPIGLRGISLISGLRRHEYWPIRDLAYYRVGFCAGRMLRTCERMSLDLMIKPVRMYRSDTGGRIRV
jgi:hypothetical protein